MSIVASIVSNHLLIESPVGETDDESCAAVKELLREVYPEWPGYLSISAGRRFTRGRTQFRELVSIAGSTGGHLLFKALRGEGIPRAIITLGHTLTGELRHSEVRAGVETVFAAAELRPIRAPDPTR